MFIYDLPNCEIQLHVKNLHFTKLQISEWSNFDRHMKRSSIEPEEMDGQICTDLKMHFVTKYFVDGQVLVHGMRHSEYH